MATDQESVQRYTAHRWAWALLCATFPLIWVGGLVTTYDAGMAVPDWPSTYGYNLFLYPWATWFYGPWDLFIEHGHRLLGALVGLLTIGLLVAILRQDSRGWMKGLAILALALVIFQGSLGGARVLLNERLLALVHGCVGPAFFAFAAALVVFTSRTWRHAVRLETVRVETDSEMRLRQVRRLAIMVTGFIYLQLIVGAHVRHVVVQSLPSTFRVLVFFHLLMAAVVVIHVGLLAWKTLANGVPRFVSRPVSGLLLLTAVQLLLGLATWVLKYGWPLGLAEHRWFAGHTIQAQGMLEGMGVTAHVAMGSLLLALSLVVVLRATCLCRYKLVDAGNTVTRVAAISGVNLFLLNAWMRRGQLTV